MNFQDYHEDIISFFDSSQSPSIFPLKTTPTESLQNLVPSPQTALESITVMQSLIAALVQIKLIMLKPCQIRYNFVIKVKQNWGLNYIICDRSKQKHEGDYCYDVRDYKYHRDNDNQLIWNLGRVWLRFFTLEEVGVRMEQKDVDRIVDKRIGQAKIRSVLKRMLAVNGEKRIQFDQLVAEDVLLKEEDFESYCFSSLILHLKKVSTITQTNPLTNSNFAKFDSSNPFIRQIKYRNFRQYQDINNHFERIKSQIQREYSRKGQQDIVKFTNYIISLQNYVNMIKIQADKISIGERFQQLDDRLLYADFTKKKVQLKQNLNRKRKILKNKSNIDKALEKYLEDPDTIDHLLVYTQFKTVLGQFMSHLQSELNQNKNDIIAMKLFTNFFLARTSSYVFAQFRTDIFDPFLEKEEKGKRGKFNLKKVLNRMYECQDVKLLSRFVNNIHKFYFD